MSLYQLFQIVSSFFLCISAARALYVTPTIPPPTYGYPTVPSVGSHSQSVIRSLDGNSVISSYSKAVDTPHSSVRKYDSRVNNDAIVYAHLPPPVVPYTAPAIYSKPAAYVNNPFYHYPAPSYYHPYPAPVYSAPASVYHPSTALYHAPSPYYHPTAIKPVAIHAPHTHYSDAATVSHLTFDGLGAHYTW